MKIDENIKASIKSSFGKILAEYNSQKEELIIELLVLNLLGKRIVLIEKHGEKPGDKMFQFHFEDGEIEVANQNRHLLLEYDEWLFTKYGDDNMPDWGKRNDSNDVDEFLIEKRHFTEGEADDKPEAME